MFCMARLSEDDAEIIWCLGKSIVCLLFPIHFGMGAWACYLIIQNRFVLENKERVFFNLTDI